MKKEKSYWRRKLLLTATAVLTIAFGGITINLVKTEAAEETNRISRAAVPTNGRIAFASTRHNTAGSETQAARPDRLPAGVEFV